jgi:hypothetical protein
MATEITRALPSWSLAARCASEVGALEDVFAAKLELGSEVEE